MEEAIVIALRNDSTLTSLLPNGAMAIGHMGVPSGTPAPYIMVLDITDNPVYTFGNNEAMSEASYNIWVYSSDTDTESAQTVAYRVLDRIQEILQGQTLVVTGRELLNLHRGPRLPSFWEVISSEERYLRMGHKWYAKTAPA